MMALAAREYLALLDNLQNFWWKPRLWIISYANDDETEHAYSCNLWFKSKVASRFQLLCIIEGEDGVAERCCEIASAFASLNDDLGNLF